MGASRVSRTLFATFNFNKFERLMFETERALGNVCGTETHAHTRRELTTYLNTSKRRLTISPRKRILILLAL